MEAGCFELALSRTYPNGIPLAGEQLVGRRGDNSLG